MANKPERKANFHNALSCQVDIVDQTILLHLLLIEDLDQRINN